MLRSLCRKARTNPRYRSIAAFTLSGLLAGIDGFLFLSRIGYVSYASAGKLLMATIASVVVSGVSLAGGVGGSNMPRRASGFLHRPATS